MKSNTSSAKWQPFCPSLNVFNIPRDAKLPGEYFDKVTQILVYQDYHDNIPSVENINNVRRDSANVRRVQSMYPVVVLHYIITSHYQRLLEDATDVTPRHVYSRTQVLFE